MAKLRVLKERQEQISVAADLRGFGDVELFQDSGLKAHLLISQETARAGTQLPITSICEAYGLSAEEKSSGAGHGAFHFQVAHQTVGDHKTQALKLFVAALEIQRTSPTTRCVLFQTSGLRAVIREKTRHEADGLSAEIEAVLQSELSKKDSKFSLHQPIAMVIHQVGLIDEIWTSEWVHLTDTQIASVHKKLTETPATLSTGKRRAG